SEASTRSAPLAHALALGGVLQDPSIRIAIGDQQPAIGCERDVGRTAEWAARRRRLTAHLNLEQLLAFGRELEHHRAGCIYRPDVASRVEPDAVRDLVETFAPRPQHASLPIHDHDRIGRVAALQEIDRAFAVDGY